MKERHVTARIALALVLFAAGSVAVQPAAASGELSPGTAAKLRKVVSVSYDGVWANEAGGKLAAEAGLQFEVPGGLGDALPYEVHLKCRAQVGQIIDLVCWQSGLSWAVSGDTLQIAELPEELSVGPVRWPPPAPDQDALGATVSVRFEETVMSEALGALAARTKPDYVLYQGDDPESGPLEYELRVDLDVNAPLREVLDRVCYQGNLVWRMEGSVVKIAPFGHLELDPGPVSGQVLDAGGEPVSGALVLLCDQRLGIPLDLSGKPFLAGLGAGRPPQFAQALTDVGGRFTIGPVPAGRYRVFAQSWPGTPPSLIEGFPQPRGKTLQVHGHADDVRVPSTLAQKLELKPLGTGSLHLREDLPSDEALLAVSTGSTYGDRILGLRAWGFEFGRGLLGASLMPGGELTVQGLPEGELHLALYVGGKLPGFGAQPVTVDPDKTVEVEMQILAVWSKDSMEPPARIRGLAEKMYAGQLDVAAALGKNPKDFASEDAYIAAVGPMQREVTLPDGDRVTVADLLAAVQYAQLKAMLAAQRNAQAQEKSPGAGGSQPE